MNLCFLYFLFFFVVVFVYWVGIVCLLGLVRLFFCEIFVLFRFWKRVNTQGSSFTWNFESVLSIAAVFIILDKGWIALS